MRASNLATAVFALSLGATTVEAQTLTGKAEAVSGNDIKVAGQLVRLWGIDAPEIDQACDRGGKSYSCGAEATSYLAVFLAGKETTCVITTYDGRGRALGPCSVDGKDVGIEMVRSGWALAYPRHGLRYVADEAAARAERLGLWGGTFSPPWQWRTAKK